MEAEEIISLVGILITALSACFLGVVRARESHKANKKKGRYEELPVRYRSRRNRSESPEKPLDSNVYYKDDLDNTTSHHFKKDSEESINC